MHVFCQVEWCILARYAIIHFLMHNIWCKDVKDNCQVWWVFNWFVDFERILFGIIKKKTNKPSEQDSCHSFSSSTREARSVLMDNSLLGDTPCPWTEPISITMCDTTTLFRIKHQMWCFFMSPKVVLSWVECKNPVVLPSFTDGPVSF